MGELMNGLMDGWIDRQIGRKVDRKIDYPLMPGVYKERWIIYLFVLKYPVF